MRLGWHKSVTLQYERVEPEDPCCALHWHNSRLECGPLSDIESIVIPRHVKVIGENCFSSSKLHHGAEYEGLSIATEGDLKGKIVERQPDGSLIRPLDLSITKTTAGLLINSCIAIIIIMCTAGWYKRHKATKDVPRKFVGLLEMLICSLMDDIIKPCVGENYRRFAPYLLTVFFFIFICPLTFAKVRKKFLSFSFIRTFAGLFR